MPTTLTLPKGACPSNLRLRDTVKMQMVDGDMYNICQRIKEIDPRLYIIDLEEPEKNKFCYAIMETGSDGTEYLVTRVTALDERVLQHLRFLMSVPLKHRIKLAEKEEAKWKAQEEEREFEEIYDRMGRPMWSEMDRCGFIPGGRGVSYPKRGVAQAKSQLLFKRA